MLNNLEIAAKKLKNGDMAGLKTIYELTSKSVFTFIFPILHDYQLSEDVMQQTYIQVYNKIDSYNPNTNFRNWILTIAKNLALGELRIRKREITSSDETIFENISEYSFSENYDSPMIKLASQVLSEDEFHIVMMYVVGGYKHREIADILQLPLGTVT